MHKHNPVPPLPPDVPRPVGDLVLSMLAKTPEEPPGVGTPRGRPRGCDQGRPRPLRSGGPYHRGPAGGARLPRRRRETSSIDPERTVGSRRGNRRLAAAGVGVALCGVGAIVAVLLTSGGGLRAHDRRDEIPGTAPARRRPRPPHRCAQLRPAVLPQALI